MQQGLRAAALTAALAAALVSSSALAAVRITLAEDIDFGCGLVSQGYYVLGVELLEQRLPQVKSDARKRRVYSALATGHGALARRRRSDLTPAQDEARRAVHQKAATEHRGLLLKMGAVAEGNLEQLMRLAAQAKTIQRDIALTPPGKERDELLKAMSTAFESGIAGLEKLHAQAKAALMKKEDEDTGDLTAAQLRVLEKEVAALQEKDLRLGVDLNRVRYWYSKALPASEAEKKRAMLAEAISGLDDYASGYADWLYSIVGNETLSRALLDVGRHEDAVWSCEAGMGLISEFIRREPKAKAGMLPWYNRLVASWIVANGKLGQFDKAIARGKRSSAPEARLAMGEAMLMKAQHYRGLKKTREADAVQARAKLALQAVADKGEPWATLASRLLEKYDPSGASFSAVFTLWRQAVRARDNPEIIAGAAKLLAFQARMQTDTQAKILGQLAIAYRQERMYYESYTVYRHIAASAVDEKDAETAAGRAVGSLQKQHGATKDAVDFELLNAAKKWRRDNFSGPGIEYERAIELKKGKQYRDAAEKFKLVKATSLYFESALEQIGECYVHAGKELEKTKPEEAEKYFGLGRKALLHFLGAIKRPAQLPRVILRRKLFEAAAVYRLATLYMRKGKEDHKACLDATEDYTKRFPDATVLHPYAMLLRVRSLVATKRLEQAEIDLVVMQRACAAMKDKAMARKLGDFATDLLSNAHVRAANRLRTEAKKSDAEAEKAAQTGDLVRARALRKRAAEQGAEAATHANKALNVITSALTANPNLPYDKYYYVVAELRLQGRFNELPRYLKLFIKQFGDKKGLTPRQAAEVDGAHVMLGEAYIESGQFKQAYDACVERFKTLDAEYKKTNEAPPEYWGLQKQIAVSAQQLAKAARDDAEKQKYVKVALRMFLDLRGKLKRGSPHWWEVTIGAVETQNIAGGHADNILVVKRTLATRPELGGGAFRERYVRVLGEICTALKDKDGRTQAFQLLMQVRTADLVRLSKEKKDAGILDVVRSIGRIAPDYGGRENREKLRAFVTSVLKATADDQMAKDATELLGTLKN